MPRFKNGPKGFDVICMNIAVHIPEAMIYGFMRHDMLNSKITFIFIGYQGSIGNVNIPADKRGKFLGGQALFLHNLGPDLPATFNHADNGESFWCHGHAWAFRQGRLSGVCRQYMLHPFRLSRLKALSVPVPAWPHEFSSPCAKRYLY